MQTITMQTTVWPRKDSHCHSRYVATPWAKSSNKVITVLARYIEWDMSRDIHVGLLETYRYKRTGQFFIWNYIGNWYVFSKYLDNYCRYQYCANDTLFRNISSILRSIFQDILPKKDVAFCETTDTAHSYIKQIVNFSEINVSIDA